MELCPNLIFDIDDKVIGVLYLSLLKKVLNAEDYVLKSKHQSDLNLQDPNKRVSLRHLLGTLAESLKEPPPGIGLKYSRHLNLVAADTLGQLMMSSKNLGQAYHHLVKFRLLLAMSFDLRLEQCSENLSVIHVEGLSHDLLPDSIKWFIAEVLFNSNIKQAEWLCGQPLKYEALHFPFAPPPHIKLYEAEFGCPLHFNSSHHQMVFPAGIFEFDILTANEDVMGHKYAVCTQALARWEKKFSISQRINAIFEKQSDKLPSIDEAAQMLNTSKSCLYRRLQEQDTSYQCLVTEFKRKRSVQLLKHTELTVAEIAEQLGFCDSSTFRRAFKSWTGMQPSCVRQKLYEEV